MMNMTYENLEVVTDKMLKHIESEIKQASKDTQHLDKKTLTKVCKVRDGLKVANDALTTLL